MPVRYSRLSSGPATRAQAFPRENTVREMTKAQLQQAAAARGLPTSGTKAELVARLEA